MESVSPVFTEREVEAERVLALDQPEYLPIIVARICGDNGYVASVTRFRLSAKELALVQAGADLLIYQQHLGPWMPIGVAVAMPGMYPEAD